MSLVNATLQYFKVSDGTKLYYQRWMPVSPKAIIVFVHGLADHVGRYGSFTNYFATRGYGVCLFDMRGHGQSGGRRTHVSHFSDYLYDLSQFIEFIKKSSPAVPLFLVGHSFGGQIVLNFVVRYAKGIRGVVALSPCISIKVEIPKWKIKLGKMAAKWLPVIRMKNDINPELLSHDRAVVDGYINDINVSKDITLRLGHEIMKNAELVMAMASRIHVPALMMHGSSDEICDSEATRKFYMRIPVYNKELKIYPGLYHELLNETDKYNVFTDINAWFEKQLYDELRLAGNAGRKGG